MHQLLLTPPDATPHPTLFHLACCSGRRSSMDPWRGFLVLWLSPGFWQQGPSQQCGGPTGEREVRTYMPLVLFLPGASGQAYLFTKLVFSTQVCFLETFPDSLFQANSDNSPTIIKPGYCSYPLWFYFANSPFVNKPSWNYPNLRVPSVSYWDCDWYRLNSHVCAQKEKQNKTLR